MPKVLTQLSQAELAHVTSRTVAYYDRRAPAFWEGTKDHDVSQNIEALLRHIEQPAPLRILDVGCGPGRDLKAFRALGHTPTGLDAAEAFVAMARAHAACEVWHQDLLALDLPAKHFDGVFANAVLFHVPSQELSRVLRDLRSTLKPGGVLFCSNPRGPDIEDGASGRDSERYGCFLTLPTWREFITDAGFQELEHYYRPEGKPLSEQPWLATVWRAL